MTTSEGEGTQSGAEGTQSGTGSTGGTNEGTSNSNADKGAQSGSETSTNTDADRYRQEADSLRERMKAADKRAADFEAKLKQLTEKDMPAQEKLTRDLSEAQKTVEDLKRVNGELALSVAFLKDNTYKWHNPERALKLVDLSQVEIQPDGTVSGLKDALKALATSDAYLVATEPEAKPETPGSTSPGNNGGTAGQKPDEKKLVSRFPALKTRIKG